MPVQNPTYATNAITQTITALATTPQSNLHLPALQSVLNLYPTTTKSTTTQAAFLKNLPTATKNASTKILNDNPPYVHLSTKDSAPQLSLDNDKLTVKGAFRGYRMVRGTHGVSSGNWYFEVMVMNPPKVSEVVKALPKNVRLGDALREGLKEGMMKERQDMRNKMMLQRQQQLKQLQQMQQQQQQQKEKDKEKEKDSNTQTTATTTTASEDNNNEEHQKKKKRKAHDDDNNNNINTNINTNAAKKNKLSSSSTTPLSPHSIGGHLRMGWSMRTGELQAPVGYDQWSYAYRNISGSRVHNSQREDKWGGESFGPGDIIGFAISLVDDTNNNSSSGAGTGGGTGITTNTSATNNNVNNNTLNTNLPSISTTASSTTSFGNKTKNAQQQQKTNHIRFFKNGEAQGHFVVSRSVRTGGAVFDNIKSGMYYPAISPYMGGAARINFGPHFIYPPRGLPTGMKVRPLSEVCPLPPTAEAVLDMFKKEKVLNKNKKVDESVVSALHEAIQVEASMRYDCFQKRLENHVVEVRKARTDRNLGITDLPVLKKTTDNSDIGKE